MQTPADAVDPRPPRRRARSIATGLLLVALCGVAFANALPDDFTYDSREIITNHPDIDPDQPWSVLWLSNYWGPHRNTGLYRPVTILSFRVERQVLGFDHPAPHAAINLLLHVGVVLLLWRLALRWIGSALGAAVAAAVYAVHPIATEVIPNLVGRADLFAAASVLGALLAWERAFDGQRTGKGWIIVALLCWLVGLFSKESAVVFPAIALLRDRVRLTSWSELYRRRRWAYAMVAVVGIAWWCWRWWVLGRLQPTMFYPPDNPLWFGSTAQRVLTALYVQALYVRLALFPLHMSADYTWNQIPLVAGPLEPRFLAGAAALLLLGVIGVLTWRRRDTRPIALGIAFFFISLLPVSNLLLLIGTMMGDRLAYLPLAGFALAFGTMVALLHARCRLRAARAGWLIVVSLVVAALIVRTHLRNPVWRNEAALWRQTIQDAPHSVRAHNNTNLWFDPSMAPDERLALEKVYLDRALEILGPLPPSYSMVTLGNLGGHYVRMGLSKMTDGQLNDAARAELERAVEVLQRAAALEDEPTVTRRQWEQVQLWRRRHGLPVEARYGAGGVHFNLGSAYYQLGRYDEALGEFEIAVAMDRQSAQGWSMLGQTYGSLHRYREARDALAKAVELNPADSDSWRFLAQAHMLLGQHEQAVRAVSRAIELAPAPINFERREDILRDWLDTLQQAGDEQAAGRLIEDARVKYGIDLDEPDP